MKKILVDAIDETMTITYEPGMTWREWVESEYNLESDDELFIQIYSEDELDYDLVTMPNNSGDYLYDKVGNHVSADSIIDPTNDYVFSM